MRSRVFVDRHPIDALIRIGAERPRIVVFASPLVGLDTLEFCARLRANKSLNDPRLVAIGDPADAAEEAALLATGADVFLTRAEAARGLAVTCDALLGRLGRPGQ
jgi:DNA-binding response OmpR family regulator